MVFGAGFVSSDYAECSLEKKNKNIVISGRYSEKYQSKIPFFLSGGINKSNCEMLKKLNFKQLYAIDLNSGFEKKPGLKDISLLKKFIEDVRN